MRAGRLRDRVQFQRETGGDDGYGNSVSGWADHGVPVPADMRETLGKEKVEAGRVEASRTATLRVRANALTNGITPADAAVVRGERWNIRSNVPVGNRGAWRDLLLEGGVAV